jgi:hypothetical protein
LRNPVSRKLVGSETPPWRDLESCKELGSRDESGFEKREDITLPR